MQLTETEIQQLDRERIDLLRGRFGDDYPEVKAFDAEHNPVEVAEADLAAADEEVVAAQKMLEAAEAKRKEAEAKLDAAEAAPPPPEPEETIDMTAEGSVEDHSHSEG